MLRFLAAFVLACLPLAVLADLSGRIQVIDGDTIDIGSERVRLFGIDAPEADQTCDRASGETWACGAWVTEQVRSRYQTRVATCVSLDTDRYGRTVARCEVDGADIGRALVSDGLAFAYRRYSMDYDLDEKAAAVNGRGLHAGRVQAPSDYRAARASAAQPSRSDCAIKGNISSRGVRIYHMPGQEHYERTRISAAKGERWFCSEPQAQAAGWRRARR
ncbi:thermonuclease family protein [Sedimentitalea sp. JM2-8]|uniref:Thermonuclease family protein n=1 Tax=Sedimentitalea xiamensis TaxID=3050037 RepID=A0ABT7FJ13_9RHOB|nr:thermonuclease family protein [Sedimentitalea xiamensis]MDK3074928.1 thermonuclease family protein [Sedimentitalea xiamensis]